MQKYSHKNIEKKWQEKWEEEKIAGVEENSSKEKFYVLDMFPYPSGAGLHMGHTESYTASDIFYRFKKMQGYNVLHPQGFDAFGLPAENYAIKTGIHPKETTKTNTNNYLEQMKMLGLGHDLKHLVYTCNPDYYKWTQFIFGKFFENGLVVRKTDKINWCSSCNTGIANEQVESGKCERCKTEIEQREVPGWFFKITDFADDLIKDLDKVDWPEHTKKNQRAWIGKSEGAKIKFKIKNQGDISTNETKKLTILILHATAGSNQGNWYPWLEENLKSLNYEVLNPNLSNAEYPESEIWLRDLEQFKDKLDENSIIIGHSLGCALAWQFLEKNDLKVKKLILVAPTHPEMNFDVMRNKEAELGLNEKQVDKITEFTKKSVDWQKVQNLTEEIEIFLSKDDPYIPFAVKNLFEKNWKATFKIYENKGHFNFKSIGEEALKFDDLLNLIVETPIYCVLNNKNEKSIHCVSNDENYLEVFTTRPDTLFGVTYMVLAPEHPLISNFKFQISNYDEVEKYQAETRKKTEMDRIEAKEKTGIELKGIKAINPANGEEVPIFIADYVLAGYGTGAIMAVPAHDERDFEFAKKFSLPIKQVIAPLFVATGENKVRPDKPNTQRNSVDVIIKHWSEDKFYCLNWKYSDWKTFVVGGIEKGESLEEAGIREAKEETGYQNMRFVKKIGGEIHSHFYASHKEINRLPVRRNCIYVELIDGEFIEPEEEHVKNHDGLWVNRKDVENYLSVPEVKSFWNTFQNGEKIWTEKGCLINSGQFNDLNSDEAKQKITEFVGGEMTANYRLRDWSVSRQRYWGCPIPIVYSPMSEAKFVGEENLPWILPEDVEFVPTGEAPLKKSKELIERTEKIFGKGWNPEFETMDTFVDSSWYFLRYPDTENEAEFCSAEKMKKWLPVDLYIGGAEHTYMHLLYARFFVKAMKKIGLVDFDEPFLKLRHQGMVLDKDGVKMSKSKGNIINPNEMVRKFGADSVRTYMMFVCPLEEDVMWNEDNIVGVYRFLEKVWKICAEREIANCDCSIPDMKQGVMTSCSNEYKQIYSTLHKTIKKVTEDIENLNLNTAISQMMIFVNEAMKFKKLPKEVLVDFVKLLAPFAPHIAEEIWREVLGNKESIFLSSFPKYNPEMIKDEMAKIVIQINGKMREIIEVNAEISEEEVKNIALKSEKIQTYIQDKEIKKVIFVKGKLVNVVV